MSQADRAGVQARAVLLQDPGSIPDLVADAIAQGATTIVAAGGDGTVSSVASCLVGRAVSLGVVPLGTLNHFAKDAGLPLDAEAAMAVVLAGHSTQVDVAEVNERTFINNSSIGLYPGMVRLRQRAGERGWRKWWAAARAMVKVLRHRDDLVVRLETADAVVTARTSLVFIGNNEYRMGGLAPGARDSLTEGTLSLYVLHARDVPGMLRTAWRIVTANAHEAEALDVFRVPEATIDLRHPRIEVALDGEVTRLQTPLRYRTRPRALRVLVPSA